MRRTGSPDAVAKICGGEAAPQLSGIAKFYQLCGYVYVTVCVSGLPGNESGFYGLHIHDGSSCAGEAFSATGGHYSEGDHPHPLHAGDLPPLLLCNGSAYLCVKTDRFRVKQILGKTVVIHSGADDFRTQPAGNAGIKIACGVIC